MGSHVSSCEWIDVANCELRPLAATGKASPLQSNRYLYFYYSLSRTQNTCHNIDRLSFAHLPTTCRDRRISNLFNQSIVSGSIPDRRMHSLIPYPHEMCCVGDILITLVSAENRIQRNLIKLVACLCQSLLSISPHKPPSAPIAVVAHEQPTRYRSARNTCTRSNSTRWMRW